MGTDLLIKIVGGGGVGRGREGLYFIGPLLSYTGKPRELYCKNKNKKLNWSVPDFLFNFFLLLFFKVLHCPLREHIQVALPGKGTGAAEQRYPSLTCVQYFRVSKQ